MRSGAPLFSACKSSNFKIPLMKISFAKNVLSMHMKILDRCVPSEKILSCHLTDLVFASIIACLSVPQPFVFFLQISWSANSGIGRVQAEKLTPGPLS